MSISNLLQPNDYKLFLNVTDEGLKLSNIPNETKTTIQSNASTEYTLVFPNKAINPNDVLAVDNIVGDKVYLKWLEVGGNLPPELPLDVINCNILNASQEVNTGEFTISSPNPVDRINTTFVQPDSNDTPFDVKLFLPANDLTMQTDSLLFIKSSLLNPPSTLEVELDYTKTLPEFNIDVFTTKEIKFENNYGDGGGQQTRFKAASFQSNNFINLILPSQAPTSNQILVTGEGGQLFWNNPTNIIENFSVFNYALSPNITITREAPTYTSPLIEWPVTVDNPTRVYQVYVNTSLQKTNTTGSFVVTRSLNLNNGNYNLVGGYFNATEIVDYITTQNVGYTFFVTFIGSGVIPIRFQIITDITQGGQLLVNNFSVTIVPVGSL